MYDEEKLDKVLEIINNEKVADILEELGSYIDERGKTKCPLHDETRPSLFVDLRKNVWFCFSCQKGGTTANLIHEYYKLNYKTQFFFNSIEKYVESHPNIFHFLGFNSLRTKVYQPSVHTLENIINQCDKMVNKQYPHYIEKLKYKPSKYCNDMEAIFDYITSLQVSD